MAHIKDELFRAAAALVEQLECLAILRADSCTVTCRNAHIAGRDKDTPELHARLHRVLPRALLILSYTLADELHLYLPSIEDLALLSEKEALRAAAQLRECLLRTCERSDSLMRVTAVCSDDRLFIGGESIGELESGAISIEQALRTAVQLKHAEERIISYVGDRAAGTADRLRASENGALYIKSR